MGARYKIAIWKGEGRRNLRVFERFKFEYEGG